MSSMTSSGEFLLNSPVNHRPYDIDYMIWSVWYGSFSQSAKSVNKSQKKLPMRWVTKPGFKSLICELQAVLIVTDCYWLLRSDNVSN